MKPVVCFIDDSTFEHDLVRNEIAPFAAQYLFVQAYTFDEAERKLGRRLPAIFLLDLWGTDDEVNDPRLSTKSELRKKIASFPGLDDVYSGLDDFKGDVTNEYLKRLFTLVDAWRSLFEEVCSRMGQNRKYGLYNLRQARVRYPDVPAVFYTRKSLITDAVAIFKAGADGLFIKPTGRNDQDTRRLTREYAPQLMDELARIISSGTRSH